MPSAVNFEIIVGTYEEYLLGYLFASTGDAQKENKLAQSFAAHDHSGSIRALASSGNYLASGATDDRIIIYDLKTRREHCMLNHHESTITSVGFTENHSHIISGSQDGTIGIVRAGNWQLEKVWKGAHKGSAIYDIAIHSSGKLALSLGADCTLQTWNLVKGRSAYVINLKSKSKDPKSLEKIVWCPDHTRFLLFGGKYIEIWSIESGGLEKIIENNIKVSSCVWLSEESILAGFEDGNMEIIDAESNERTEKKAHNTRVKAIVKFDKWIVTASSNGEIKVWSAKLTELTKIETGCRITCLSVVSISDKVKMETEVPDKEDLTVQNNKQKKIQRSVIVEIEDDEDVCKFIEKKKVQIEDQVEVIGKQKKKRKKTEVEDKVEVQRKQKKKHLVEAEVEAPQKQKKKKRKVEEQQQENVVKKTRKIDVKIENKVIETKNKTKKNKQNIQT